MAAGGRRAHNPLQAVHAMTDDQHEAFSERAAILQFDAGMSRSEAEKLAARQMLLTPEDLIEFEQGKKPKAGFGSVCTTTKGSK